MNTCLCIVLLLELLASVCFWEFCRVAMTTFTLEIKQSLHTLGMNSAVVSHHLWHTLWTITSNSSVKSNEKHLLLKVSALYMILRKNSALASHHLRHI